MSLKATRTITSSDDKTAKFSDGEESIEFTEKQILDNLGFLEKKRSRKALELYFNRKNYKQISEEIDLSQQYTKKILRRSISKICESIHEGKNAKPVEEKSTGPIKETLKEVKKDPKETSGIGIQPTENCKACGKKIENGDPHLCEACRYELDTTSNYIACPSCGKQRHKIQLDYHGWTCPNCNTKIPKDKRPIKS